MMKPPNSNFQGADRKTRLPKCTAKPADTPTAGAVAVGTHVLLRRLLPDDAPLLCDYYVRNREFFHPWDPVRPTEFFSVPGQQHMIDEAIDRETRDLGYRFAVALKADPTAIIGVIGLNNVVRGVFQNADLGFSLDQAHTGHGYMTDAVQLTIRHAFFTLRLHRLQAAVQPDNAPSQAVLQRAGFRPEGSAQRYLNIAGAWRDHLIFAITTEDCPPTPR